jgi:flagellar protein FlgJ
MEINSPDTSLALMQATQNSVANTADATKAAGKKKLNDAQLTQAAQDFEAMFMTEMMKPMFEDIKPDEMFGGGKGEEIFQGFMLEEYGKIMAQTGQIGIADQVKAEMMRMQESK